MEGEKRLIDAYALMNQVRESKHKNPHKELRIARNHMYEHDHFTKLICLAPTVDAVEVVRCKDCTSGKGSTYKVCPLYKQGLMKDDDYCSKGERKDNG